VSALQRPCRFDTHSVRRWAEFSGDENPIHFSADHAARFGLAGVVAHGMLVLVPAQLAAGDVLPAGGPDTWYQFRAFFRKPVPTGAPCLLNVGRTRRGVQFSVDAGANSAQGEADCYVRGSYGTAGGPAAADDPGPGEAGGSPWQTVSTEALRSRHVAFSRIAGRESAPQWAFLSALVFSEYLRSQLGHDVAQWAGATAGSSSAWQPEQLQRWDERDDLLVMQTALAVRHAAPLRAPAANVPQAFEPVHWRRSALRCIPAATELIGSVGLDLVIGPPAAAREPALQLEISLVARRLAARPEFATP
jgi:MaoC like domain